MSLFILSLTIYWPLSCGGFTNLSLRLDLSCSSNDFSAIKILRTLVKFTVMINSAEIWIFCRHVPVVKFVSDRWSVVCGQRQGKVVNCSLPAHCRWPDTVKVGHKNNRTPLSLVISIVHEHELLKIHTSHRGVVKSSCIRQPCPKEG